MQSTRGAGHFSITSAGQLSSVPGLTEKWLYALEKLRNPGQVSKHWVKF